MSLLVYISPSVSRNSHSIIVQQHDTERIHPTIPKKCQTSGRTYSAFIYNTLCTITSCPSTHLFTTINYLYRHHLRHPLLAKPARFLPSSLLHDGSNPTENIYLRILPLGRLHYFQPISFSIIFSNNSWTSAGAFLRCAIINGSSPFCVLATTVSGAEATNSSMTG